MKKTNFFTAYAAVVICVILSLISVMASACGFPDDIKAEIISENDTIIDGKNYTQFNILHHFEHQGYKKTYIQKVFVEMSQIEQQFKFNVQLKQGNKQEEPKEIFFRDYCDNAALLPEDLLKVMALKRALLRPRRF